MSHVTSKPVEEPTPSPVKRAKPENDSDIVGSPLRDDCEVKNMGSPVLSLRVFDPWEEVNNYTGFKVETARDILNHLINNQEMKDDCGSVWILCNGTDYAKTLFLELEADAGWWTRGVVVSRGRSEMLDLLTLVKKHQAMIRHASNPTVIVDSFFTFNNYTVLRISNDKTHNLNFFQDTTITLYQTFNLQEHRSLAIDLFPQVFLLNTIYETIVRYREDYDEDSGDPEYHGVEGVTTAMITDEISKIFMSIPEQNVVVEDNEENVRSPLENAVLKANKRQLINVTDQLWEILKLCHTFRDLKSALNTIFLMAAKSNIINLPSKSSKLGELIHDIGQQRIAIPQLIGCQPLELLLEIGIEKVTHDFEFIFSSACICQSAELKANLINKIESKSEANMNVRKSLHNAGAKPKPVEEPKRKTLLTGWKRADLETNDIGFQNSRFNQFESETKISRLLQIYYTLEHLLLLHTNIGTDAANVSVAKQVLFEEPESIKKYLQSPVHKLKVDVVGEKILNLIYGRQPSAQRVAIKSENALKKLETINYFSEDPLMPPHVYPNLFPTVTLSTTVENPEKNMYWLVSYTKIGSKLK